MLIITYQDLTLNFQQFLLLIGYTYSTKTMESHLKSQFPLYVNRAAACTMLQQYLGNKVL